MPQVKQREWYEQWTLVKDNDRLLFEDWISPNRLADFRGKTVLECGCGAGQHTDFVAPYARKVIAVDLNTVNIARQRNAHHSNVRFVEGDIAEISFNQLFDVVFCVGVIHHTDEPARTFGNLKRLVKPGGRLIVWCYAREGNFGTRVLLEQARKLFLRHLSRRSLLPLANFTTALVFGLAYSVYLLPLGFLPYYRYMAHLRRLGFQRSVTNIYNHMNQPQPRFIARAEVEAWFNPAEFSNVHISSYVGVSWRASGTRRG